MATINDFTQGALLGVVFPPHGLLTTTGYVSTLNKTNQRGILGTGGCVCMSYVKLMSHVTDLG